MKTLLIKLSGPMQSWGNEAAFEWRTSHHAPTKSAIIGMIAAALGLRRTDERIAKLNELKYAVRIDQPGKMTTDYQTVHYRFKTHVNTKVTNREYLQDAVFVVAVGSEDKALIETIALALERPKFALFLGRRAFPLAGVLETWTRSTDPVSALHGLGWQASNWFMQKQARFYRAQILADAELLSDHDWTLIKDQAKSFDPRHREYAYRAQARDAVMLSNPLSPETHDLWEQLG